MIDITIAEGKYS